MPVVRRLGIVSVFLDKLYYACAALAGLCLISICGLMMVMSVGREIRINVPAGNEFCGWLCASMATLGLAYGLKHGDIVRVGLLVERFDGRARQAIEILCLIIGTLFTAALAWYAVDLVHDAWRFNEKDPGVVPMPIWIPKAPFAFGAVVLFLAFFEDLVGALRGIRPSYWKDPPKTQEEVIERAASSAV